MKKLVRALTMIALLRVAAAWSVRAGLLRAGVQQRPRAGASFASPHTTRQSRRRRRHAPIVVHRATTTNQEKEETEADDRAAAIPLAATPATDVPPELRAKILEYLAARETLIDQQRSRRDEILALRAETMANPAWRATNWLLSIESLLPKVPKEVAESADALSYTELDRFGYGRLIEPIMKAGGHVEVSRAMGLEVQRRAATPKRAASSSRRVVTAAPTRGLSLGAAREAKLDGIATANLTAPSALIARTVVQRSRPDDPGADATTTTMTTATSVPSPPRRSTAAGADSASVVETTADASSSSSWPLLLAPLSLGAAARVYAVLGCCALAAAPDASKATQRVVELYGGDVGRALELLHDASFVFVSANLAAAALAIVQHAASPSPQQQPSAGGPLASVVVRRLVGGPLAILEDSAERDRRSAEDEATKPEVGDAP